MKRNKTVKNGMLFLTIALLLFSFKPETQVYICNTKSSKKYHYSKSCRGLSRCSASIEDVTIKKAKALGRTLCGWED
ncbi:hypothetical protein [uncultured Maribacter sp.]|uniref:hypothetical protein n=1 Tax=uncultured Maribacter sp. TaxID=431308 RepID=UPI00261FDEC5|nr:hypothetical protein [uncultured Maribacter sp.]